VVPEIPQAVFTVLITNYIVAFFKMQWSHSCDNCFTCQDGYCSLQWRKRRNKTFSYHRNCWGL